MSYTPTQEQRFDHARDLRKHEERPDDKLCSALSAAKMRGPEIIGLLHSAYHDGYLLPEGRVAERLAAAREQAEKLLVSILAAEQAMAPETADA